MKKYLIFLLVVIFQFNNLVTSQNLQDTKDYIIEKIETNPPLGNTSNNVWFKDNIKLEFLSGVLGIKATEDYLTDGLMIYCRTQYTSTAKSNFLFAIYYTFDIGSVSKISISPNTTLKDVTAYNINLYLIEKPFAVKFTEFMVGENEYHLDFGRKIDIIVGSDESLAKKIKSAIIHFGNLNNVTIKDGDVF